MSFLQGIETGRGMARGAITAYETSNLRRREEEAAREIAALNEQYRRSGEVVEEPPASTGLAPNQVSRVSATGAPTAAGLTRYQMGSAAGAPVDQRPTRTIDATRGPTLGGTPTQPVTQPVTPQPRRQMTESEFNRQRANVYARMGLADRAAEATEAAIQAERYEQQTARQSRLDEIAQQQYEREFRLTSARDERDAAREVREQGLYEENRAVRAQTRDATNFLLSNPRATFSDLQAQFPNADLGVTYPLYLQSRTAEEQANERRAMADFTARKAEDPQAPVGVLAAQVAEQYGVDQNSVIAGFLVFNEAERVDTENRINDIKRQVSLARSPEDLSAATEALFGTEGEKWELVPSDERDPESERVWMLMSNGQPLRGAGVYPERIGAVLGWKIAQTQLLAGLNEADPLMAYQLIADLNKQITGELIDKNDMLDIYKIAVDVSKDATGRVDPQLLSESVNNIVSYINKGGQLPAVSEETAEATRSWYHRFFGRFFGGEEAAPVAQTGIDATAAAPAQQERQPRGYVAMRQRERAAAIEDARNAIAEARQELERLTTARGGSPAIQTPRGLELVEEIRIQSERLANLEAKQVGLE